MTVVLIALIPFLLIVLLLMWIWTTWSKQTKIIITAGGLFIIAGIVAVMVWVIVNPEGKVTSSTPGPQAVSEPTATPIPKITSEITSPPLKLPSLPPLRITMPKTPNPPKFKSFGEKTIEEGITAKITSAVQENDRIKIKVTFKNISSVAQEVKALRLSMRSQTRGGMPEPSVFFTLAAGQSRELEFSYRLLPDPPFRFIYANVAGDGEVELGTYTPS